MGAAAHARAAGAHGRRGEPGAAALGAEPRAPRALAGRAPQRTARNRVGRRPQAACGLPAHRRTVARARTRRPSHPRAADDAVDDPQGPPSHPRDARTATAEAVAARARRDRPHRSRRPSACQARAAADARHHLSHGRLPVRHRLAHPGRDQPRRDEPRPEHEHLERGRRGLDAVHAVDVAPLGHRRVGRRGRGSVRPAGCDLQRRPLPRRRGRAEGPAAGDLRLQPCRVVRQRDPRDRRVTARRLRP